MKNKLFLNTFILTGSSLLLSTLRMYLRVFLSGKIGAEGMGLYQLILSVYFLAASLAVGGIGIAVTRLVSERNHLKSATIVSRSLTLALGAGLFIGIALYFVSQPLSLYVLSDSRTMLSLKALSLSLPALSASACFRGYFIGRRKVVQPAFAMVFEQIAQVYLTFILVNHFLPFGIEYACMGAILANSCSETLSCVFLAVLYLLQQRNISKTTPMITKSPKIYSKIFAIFLPVASGAYIQSALGAAENVLIPAGLRKYESEGVGSLSLYGTLRGMAFPVLFFPASFLGAFATLLLPELSRANTAGQHAKSREIVTNVITKTMQLSILVAGIFVFFGRELGILLYNQPSVGTTLQMLAPLIPFLYLEDIADSMLKALNQQVSALRYTVYTSLFRIIAIFLLLPLSGAKGYIVILYVSTFISFSLSLSKLLKVTKIRPHFLSWVVAPACAVVFCCILAKALRFCPGSQALLTISSIAFSAGLFLFLFCLLHLRRKHNQINTQLK